LWRWDTVGGTGWGRGRGGGDAKFENILGGLANMNCTNEAKLFSLPRFCTNEAIARRWGLERACPAL
jgi:hypothetical protein